MAEMYCSLVDLVPHCLQLYLNQARSLDLFYFCGDIYLWIYIIYQPKAFTSITTLGFCKIRE